MFESNCTINGKHASYIKFLVNEAKVFKRYIDVYMTGAIVGILKNRRSEETKSEDRARIYSEQFNSEYVKCNEIFRTVILADESKNWSNEERIDICFRYRDTFDDYAVPVIKEDEIKIMKEASDLFNSYVLGGIEILYDIFNSTSIEEDDMVDYAYKSIFDHHSFIENNSASNEDDLLKAEY